METKAPNKLAGIRTFAKDLEKGRSVKSSTPTKSKEKEVTEVTTPKVVETTRATDTLTAEIIKPKNHTPQKPVTKLVSKPINPTKTEPTIIVDNEDAAAATIITDTKRGEFKLIPAIINSIQSWFKKKQQDYAAKKVPKYTVPDTIRRKGIIQKATSKSGKFAASDFSSIQERILERKAAAEKAKETPTDKNITAWSANTEPGFLLLSQTTTPQISNVKVVPRKTFRALPEEVVITKSKTEEVVTQKTTTDLSEPENKPLKQPIAEVTTVAEVAPVKAKPTVVIPEPTPALATKEIEAPEVTKTPAAEAEAVTTTQKQPFNLLRIDTNALTVLVSGFIIALTMVVATLYFLFYKDNADIVHSQIPETLLNNTDITQILLYDLTASAVLDALEDLRNERGTTEGVFMYTSTIGSTNAALPADIINALTLNVPPDFTQTVSDIRIGHVNQAPYLLLKIKDRAVAQGGLLMWEKTMYQDLMPILYLATEDTSNFFDSTIANSDVRVFKNPTGGERLLYGIVSGTIVITTNSASFAQLTDLLK